LLIAESRKTNYIVIEKDKCKACHYCIAVCAREIIGTSKEINRLGVNYAEVIPDKAHECTGCKSCAIMCPDIAISVFRSRALEDGSVS
jgi:2-oxoglutarate ferredoxin oxidoreductase subunit delta